MRLLWLGGLCARGLQLFKPLMEGFACVVFGFALGCFADAGGIVDFHCFC